MRVRSCVIGRDGTLCPSREWLSRAAGAAPILNALCPDTAARWVSIALCGYVAGARPRPDLRLGRPLYRRAAARLGAADACEIATHRS
jgi:hypothetical protein